MKPATRLVRLAAATALILAAALAAIIGGYRYSSGEPAAEPETLQRIARKNDVAAMQAASRMAARSDAIAAAKESDESNSAAGAGGR